MKQKLLSILVSLALIGCAASQLSAQRNIAPANLVAQSAQTCATAAPAVLCIAVTVTPGSGLVTATPNVTPLATVTPTQGQPTPTQIAPQATIGVTQIVATVPPNSPNLLVNPGLDHSAAMPYRELVTRKIVAWGWQYFECWPDCPALRIGSGNPAGLMMGPPEFKSASNGGTAGREWIQGNTAQSWFIPWQPYQGGVYQSVTVTPGATCTAGAKVRSWSQPGDPHTSKLDTADDRANSEWRIWVHPFGGTNWRANDVLQSRGFGFSDGIYDNYAPIEFTFSVPEGSNRITVFFGDTRLWGFGNNQSYIDAAYLRCAN